MLILDDVRYRCGVLNRVARRRSARGTVKVRELDAALLAWDGICPLCDKPVGASELALDHIFPIASGGENYIDNIQFVHKRCNSIKGHQWGNAYARKIIARKM